MNLRPIKLFSAFLFFFTLNYTTGIQVTSKPQPRLSSADQTVTWAGEEEIFQRSLNTWKKEKARCQGNYSYRVNWSSWTGFGNETIIVVRNNRVVERQFKSFSPPKQSSITTNTKNWKEKGDLIGSNQEGYPPKTMDQLYSEAANLINRPIPPSHLPTLRLNQGGILLSCFIQDTRIADDAPIQGVNITSISLGKQKELNPKDSPPTFEEWMQGGKKIPEGMMFIGGSPWFDESTGKNRKPSEVYDMIFGKKKGSIDPDIKPVPRPPLTNKRKPFPRHWGDPPKRQTRDLRTLPGGYGMGSGTLGRWIQENLDRDKPKESTPN